ncbi:MAG: hypothetical protein EZS28_006373 [Streblomastix strix]|uniref:Uncharacterized protein n=1 Tax=Streblomastix strix TaxID=222440 RepID=A0A5J4WU68_9EUKA|nr:MAG: hypothetical protein EZS28_006373 [Streblomastix strix]
MIVQASTFKLLGSYWKVVTPKGRTRLEQGDQKVDMKIGLTDAQEALLVATKNGLGGLDNIEQIPQAYSMQFNGTNAVTQLKELVSAPRELRGVVRNCILPVDVFSNDSIDSIKRAVHVPAVFNPVTLYDIVFVPAILAIPIIPAIQDVADAVCDELIQLRKGSCNGKKIPDKRTWMTRQGSLQFQFRTIRKVVRECLGGYLEWRK